MNNLRVSDNQLYDRLLLTAPIALKHFVPTKLKYFDKDGFELTPIEKILYDAHNVQINDHLYHVCNQIDWILQEPVPSEGAVLDHSMLLHRFGVGGKLREQVEWVARRQPIFSKLANCQPKWGLDFSMDYVDRNGALEVLHIEFDAKERGPVQEMKLALERRALNMDWQDAANTVRKHADEWQHLEGMDQTDWKAKFFGFPRAECTQKAW